MKILAIESSSLVASAAIVQDDVLVAEYTVDYKKTHSQTLLPMIDEIVRMTETDLHTVDAIAVSGGPGSFTGLRIGGTTAKGLGLALDKPLIHVPTVDALAYNLYGCGKLICPIMDARRSQVYTGLYRFGDGFEVIKKTDALAIDAVLGELKLRREQVVFLGDGVPVHREHIIEVLGNQAEFAPASVSRQRAASVACLGAELYAAGQYESADEFTPDYLRMSQAEREFVTISQLKDEDLEAVSALEARSFADGWSVESLRRTFANPCNTGLIAMHRDEFAGYVIAQRIAGEGEILRIAVKPELRRSGVGRRLIAALEEASPDITEWNLEVRASNEPARGLYGSAGYVPMYIRQDYYSDPVDDAVCMKKVLG